MNDKKPYSTPQIFQVELNHEQAILTGCSTLTHNFKMSGTLFCRPSGTPCKKGNQTTGDSGPALS
jgi:hypothetical protein